MRPARLATYAAALAALALAPAASGAGPSCHLVVDPKGDQRDRNYTGDVAPAGSDLDVVGADVASDGSYLTAVVRLATLRPLDTGEPGGHYYEVAFRVGPREFELGARYGVDGVSGRVREGGEHGAGRVTPARVSLHPDRREVAITVPANVLGALDGKRVSGIVVHSHRYYGLNGDPVGQSHTLGNNPGASARVDTAKASRGYVAGTRSCVTVGP